MTKNTVKRRKWVLVGIIGLLCVYAVWRFSPGPNTDLIISKQTTYLTEPLTEDGLVDYEKALNDKIWKGVTTQNNAARDLVAVMGDELFGITVDLMEYAKEEGNEDDEAALKAEKQKVDNYRTLIYERLGLKMQDIQQAKFKDFRTAYEAHLDEQDQQNKPADDKKSDKRSNYRIALDAQENIFAGNIEQFAQAELSFLQQWIAEHQPYFDAIAAAAQKTHFAGTIHGTGAGINASLARMRDLFQIYWVYGHYLIYKKQYDEAFHCVLNIGKLSELWVKNAGAGFDWLAANSTFYISFALTKDLIRKDALTKAQRNKLIAFYKQFNFKQPYNNSVEYERLMLLMDLQKLYAARNNPDFPQNMRVFNINPIIKQLNADFDHIESIHQLGSFGEIKEAFEQFNKDVASRYPKHEPIVISLNDEEDEEPQEPDTSRSIESYLVNRSLQVKWATAKMKVEAESLTRPGYNIKFYQQMTLNIAHTQNIIGALALENYFEDHGDYPENLTALVPDYLDKIPIDPHSNKPLQYRRVKEGYVIYSVGWNMKDEKAAKDDWKKDYDDILFRCKHVETDIQPESNPQ